MEKLTSSKRLNYLLGQMGIFSSYDVINHLPRRYEDLNYTHDRDLTDKERVVLLGKLISTPKVVKTRNISIVRFDFVTSNRRYFRVVAFNRPYLGKIVNLVDDFTLVGNYDLKKNEINLMNIYKGEISIKDRIKPIYTLPSDYQQYLFANLVGKSLEAVKGHIFSDVPFDYLNKYPNYND